MINVHCLNFLNYKYADRACISVSQYLLGAIDVLWECWERNPRKDTVTGDLNDEWMQFIQWSHCIESSPCYCGRCSTYWTGPRPRQSSLSPASCSTSFHSLIDFVFAVKEAPVPRGSESVFMVAKVSAIHARYLSLLWYNGATDSRIDVRTVAIAAILAGHVPRVLTSCFALEANSCYPLSFRI